MDKKKRGCLLAGCGVAIVLLMVGAAVVGGLAWMVYQGSSFRLEHPDEKHAGDALDAMRQRFKGQAPLVTIGPDGSTSMVPRPGSGQSPESLHVMLWNPAEKELAQVQFPFWLVRLAGAKAKFTVNGVDAAEQLRKVNVTIDDLEQSGPGLVLDHADRDGTQMLIWTE